MGLKKIGLTVIEQTHRLTCHCEAVVIELTLPDGVVTPQRCNCSFCRRRGAIVADIAEENIRLVNGHDQLRRYQFRSHTAEHYFCGSCGIYTHHRRRSNPQRFGYNVGCLKGVNPFEIEDVALSDGINHPLDR